MDQGSVMELAQNAMRVVLLVSAPLLGLSLIVGLAISIFQATTQIQEQTLTFIPKVLAVMGGLAFFGAWMLRVLIEYTQSLYTNMNQFIK